MCTPSPPKDNSAEIARQEEAARQERIAEGKTAIDNEFAQYNDDFYNQYQTDYTSYYDPQLNDQYADARKDLTLQLAKQGQLTSSVGANQMADLEEHYNTQKLGLTGQATDATNSLRSSVDSRLSQLYSDNRASADPGSATALAASAAQALQPSAPTSPLANVFGDFFSNLGNAAAINNQTSYSPQQGGGVQNYSSGSGSSSGSVVG